MGALMTKENKKAIRREQGICSDLECTKSIGKYEREELGGFCFGCYDGIEDTRPIHPDNVSRGIV